MSPELRIGATGFGLIAICYGFARFAFGLFLPQIDQDLSLGSTLSGVISGGSFLGCGFRTNPDGYSGMKPDTVPINHRSLSTI